MTVGSNWWVPFDSTPDSEGMSWVTCGLQTMLFARPAREYDPEDFWRYGLSSRSIWISLLYSPKMPKYTIYRQTSPLETVIAIRVIRGWRLKRRLRWVHDHG